jgi:hypothetical protein
MPYVDGESLRDRLNREKQLPIEDALQTTREVADALGYAHEQGIVHRDIKPENILFQRGHALVADFGIARAVSAAGAETLTETGLAVGTPAYMSPEQGVGSGDLDGRSDLYSLGCVLYEMLTGETPYLGSTPQAIIAKKLSEPTPRVSALRRTVPEAVDTALRRVLAHAPVDRHATASQFVAALAPTGMIDVQTPPRAGRAGRPRQVLAGVATGVLTVVAIAVVLLWPAQPNTSLDDNLIAVMPFRTGVVAAERHALVAGIPDAFAIVVNGDFGPRIADVGGTHARWASLAGPDSLLTGEQQLAIARDLGAGRLVRGYVTETDAGIQLDAELLAVPSGAVVVSRKAVEGTEWFSLLDELITTLIVRGFGDRPGGWSFFRERVPVLGQYDPRAVQAYLAGLYECRNGTQQEKSRLFREALRLDSTFAWAGLASYSCGEWLQDSAEARVAWEQRHRFGVADQLWIRALIGPLFGGVPTASAAIAAWDSLTRLVPDRASAWGELAEELEYFGAIAGEPRWLTRARRAIDRSMGLTRDTTVWHLRRSLHIAILQRDTARIREDLNRLAVGRALAWHVAHLLGERTDTIAILSSRPTQLAWAVRYALALGRGVELADSAAVRLAETGDWSRLRSAWRRARGDYAAWRSARDAYYEDLPEVTAAVLRLRDVLFLGEQPDAAARESAELLATVTSGHAGTEHSADDAARARCWGALWRTRHGDTTGAAQVGERLRTTVEPPHRFAVCALLVEVLAANGERQSLELIRRLDTLVRAAPFPLETWEDPPRDDLTQYVDNLVLARLLSAAGDTAAALAAARRRYRAAHLVHLDITLVDMLREEGRLAAAVGDTTGAIAAYEHYLALREDPDPPWRAQWDSVRAELSALVAR